MIAVPTDSPVESRSCRWCGSSLAGKRADAGFCGDRCRTDWHRSQPPEGAIKAVRRLKRGVSVTVHMPDGRAAERALKLELGDLVRIVRGPA